jgi:hypothetical protein
MERDPPAASDTNGIDTRRVGIAATSTVWSPLDRQVRVIPGKRKLL